VVLANVLAASARRLKVHISAWMPILAALPLTLMVICRRVRAGLKRGFARNSDWGVHEDRSLLAVPV
jgi:hypothetical protein